MNRLSKKMISMMISLALVLSMLISGMAMAAVTPGAAPGAAGTLKITGSVSGEGADEVNQILEVSDLTISFKSDQTIKALINAVVGGMDFFTLRAEGDSSHLVFEIPQAMENAVSVDFATFGQNIGGQLQTLLEQMGLDLNDLSGNLPSAVSPAASMSPEEIQDMMAPYIEIFSENIMECTSIENGVDIELANLETTVQGDLYTWAPTAEQFAEISEKLGNLMKEDDRLIVLYREQLDQMRPFYEMLANFSNDMSTEDIAEAYNQIDAVLEQLPDMMIENADDIGTALEEMALSVQVGVAADGPTALVRLSLVNEGQELSFGLENATTLYTDTMAALFMNQGEMGFAAIYKSADTETEFAGTVDLKMNGYSMGQITYSVSKTEKTRLGMPVMNIAMNFGTAALTVDNVKSADQDVLSLDVSGISMFTGDNSIDGFHIDAASTDEDLTQDIEGQILDISNYTLEQLGGLINQIGEGLSNYYNNL